MEGVARRQTDIACGISSSVEYPLHGATRCRAPWHIALSLVRHYCKSKTWLQLPGIKQLLQQRVILPCLHLMHCSLAAERSHERKCIHLQCRKTTHAAKVSVHSMCDDRRHHPFRWWSTKR